MNRSVTSNTTKKRSSFLNEFAKISRNWVLIIPWTWLVWVWAKRGETLDSKVAYDNIFIRKRQKNKEIDQTNVRHNLKCEFYESNILI